MNTVKFVDMHFSQKENEILDNIKINNSLAFTNYYDKNKFEEKVKEFIEDIGDNKNISRNVVEIINKIVKQVMDEMKQESAIIWIRTQVSHERKQFRWHRDGRYFKTNDASDLVYKFVISLSGNSTPIITNDNIIKKYDDNLKKSNEIYGYVLSKIKTTDDFNVDFSIFLSDSFEQTNNDTIGDNYVTSKPREGVYILNNGHKDSVIHSEPLVEKNRLFIAILPYTTEKCKEWIVNRIK